MLISDVRLSLLIVGSLLVAGCNSTPPENTDLGNDGQQTAPSDSVGPPSSDSGQDTDDQVNTDTSNGDDAATLSTEDVQAASWQVIGNSGIASAFAVDDNLLATNAHVVQLLVDDPLSTNGLGVAVQHETGRNFLITRAWIHRDYDGSAATSPDIGVLEIDGILPTVLPLADTDSLEAVRVFDSIRLCGFPADVTLSVDVPSIANGATVHRPRATCLSGEVTSLRPFDAAQSATANNSQLIQHNIATTQGTSGSPVYDEAIGVVAVNASGTVDEAGLNRFAARADTLVALLKDVRAGLEPEQVGVPGNIAPPTPTPAPSPTPPPLASYPLVILDPAPGCNLICIQYLPFGELFCDSDCDGWYDAVEIEFGHDRCNPFSPPFLPPPSVNVPICEQVFGKLRVNSRAAQIANSSALAEQQEYMIERR